MSSEHPTVWDEGMFLVPQHFQQQDRAVRMLIRDRLGSLYPHGWGVTALEIDEEALRSGDFRLTACSGVLRSGLVFRAPERDPLPASRSVGDAIDPRVGQLTLYVGVPKERLGMPACDSGEGLAGDGQPADGVPTPYRRRVVSFPDANLPTSSREVPVAVPNLRVLRDGDPLEEYEILPIARVAPSKSGGCALDHQFLPTCLHIGASTVVMETLRGFVEILARRSTDLSGQHGRTGGVAEAATLWMRHTVNSHLPALLHFQEVGTVHPETVFLELLRLAGELCTFAPGAHPRDLPRYRHEDFGGCVHELEQQLRRLLDGVIPNRCVPIPVERVSDSLFTASLADAQLLDGELYLAVAAEVQEEQLLREFPAKAKISSREQVQTLLMRAMSGLSVNYVANPPDDIPVQPGRHYFRLDRDGEHWEAIRESQSLAMHLPPTFPGLKIEMMSLQEGE